MGEAFTIEEVNGTPMKKFIAGGHGGGVVSAHFEPLSTAELAAYQAKNSLATAVAGPATSSVPVPPTPAEVLMLIEGSGYLDSINEILAARKANWRLAAVHPEAEPEPEAELPLEGTV